jgi:hypothetical protein
VADLRCCRAPDRAVVAALDFVIADGVFDAGKFGSELNGEDDMQYLQIVGSWQSHFCRTRAA